ncbi:MAG: hypothetical protein QNK37_27560 [Acidobacteriota bacterium]|nr:hypothetical protein [Acidobacteriota bacterium]
MLQGAAVLFTVVGFGLVGDGTGTLSWTLNLADSDTPGVPILIEVVVYEADGKTPVAGALVEVYHSAHSAVPDTHEHHHEGVTRTNADGRFRIRSVRPGPFPDVGMPAHIHVIIEPPRGRKHFLELHFADDPNLTRAQVRRDKARGEFGYIRPLKKDENGLYRGCWKIRLDDVMTG